MRVPRIKQDRRKTAYPQGFLRFLLSDERTAPLVMKSFKWLVTAVPAALVLAWAFHH